MTPVKINPGFILPWLLRTLGKQLSSVLYHQLNFAGGSFTSQAKNNLFSTVTIIFLAYDRHVLLFIEYYAFAAQIDGFLDFIRKNI